MLQKEIAEIKYKKEEKYAGNKTEGVIFFENVVKFKDETTRIRKGIINIKGKTIKAKKQSLVTASNMLNGWWSLQATNITELKAAHQAGYRNKDLNNSPLKDYFHAYIENGHTLHLVMINE